MRDHTVFQLQKIESVGKYFLKISNKPKKNKNMCHMSIKHTENSFINFSVTHFFSFNYNTNNFQIYMLESSSTQQRITQKTNLFLSRNTIFSRPFPMQTKKIELYIAEEKNHKKHQIRNLIINIFLLMYMKFLVKHNCGNFGRVQTKKIKLKKYLFFCPCYYY